MYASLLDYTCAVYCGGYVVHSYTYVQICTIHTSMWLVSVCVWTLLQSCLFTCKYLVCLHVGSLPPAGPSGAAGHPGFGTG